MQLNEIVEENSLPTISRKTRISVQNLEALLARDWSRLKKVQALGFLSILEREYHLDLSDMKAECRAYFEAHVSVEDACGPVITAAPEPEHRGPSGALVFLVILLAALGGYLLFFSPAGESGASSADTGTAVQKTGFFSSVLSTAKGWFGREGQEVKSELEAPDDESPAVKGAWAERNGSAGNEGAKKETAKHPPEAKPLTSGASKATAEKATAEKAPQASKPAARSTDEAEETQIIQQVKKEQARAEEIRRQAVVEENGTSGGGKELSEISKMILAATAGAEASPSETVTQTPAASASEAGESKQARTPSAEKNAPEEGAAQPSSNSSGVTDTLVVMHPRSKIWIGYTNLRTMKRSAKVTTEDLSFDTAKGDYILAVGHGLIDFRTRQGEKKLNDGKRHFFMIAKGDVREISHEEFQRLNKSKVW